MRTSPDPTLVTAVHERLAEHYTDRLALNWRRRRKLLGSPAADFAALADWDARLDVALEALWLLGPVARQHMTRCLESPVNPGAAFAVVCHALHSRQGDLAEAAAAIVRTVPPLHGALVAALQWCEPSPLWHRIAATLPLAERFDLIAARHRDAPALLPAALDELKAAGPTSGALAAGLRCLRHQGQAALALAGLHHLQAADAQVRRQAAQAVLALAPQERQASAVEALLALVRDDGSQREPAARCLALHCPRRVLPLLDELRARDAGACTRLYLQALGWSGDVAAVPQLIEQLSSPAHARVAAGAITLLTGLDPVRDGWQGEPLAAALPRPDDASSTAIAAADPDAGLPWPARAAFEALWQGARARYCGAHVLLGGRPATTEHLGTVLRQGPLPWRSLAAARLQRLSGGALFPTALPARAQVALFTA